mmetsp:Transcript_27973/g.31426  ORF Transcript_27973/g.31426 Transcript_27973/m.31426 type:complete len:91 (+) Transcript_27973:39-311(+)
MTPRNSSFGLLGKRSGHFFKSKRDNLKDSESLATSADDATEEEEYDMANAEVEHILGTTKPKHIAEGLQSGLGYILRGAVGAAGVMVVCF